jgi:glycosyltransferase involved in cell wall biosynthesis
MLKMNLNKKPLISVVMCTFNNQLTLKRAINSVIKQDFKLWELIVVDANSNDDTKQIITQYASNDPRIKFKFMNYQSKWVESTLIGLDKVQGEFCMFLDADDYISVNYLGTLLKVLHNEKCVGAAGNLKLVNVHGKEIINNPSSNRVFGFTNNKLQLVRLSMCFLTPESFGLVNCLYGLWNTKKLREIELWSRIDNTLNFDQIFVLNVLQYGRVSYYSKVFHVRLSHSKKAKTFTDKKIITLKNSKIKWVLILLRELLIVFPPIRVYSKWILQNKSMFSPFFVVILALRTLLALPVKLIKIFRSI